MSNLYRRSIPRMALGWVGECRPAGHADADWVSCKILDLSPTGAGLEIDTTTGAPVDLGTALEVRITLLSEVRNVLDRESGTLRVGVELDHVSGEVAKDIEALNAFDIRW